MDPSSFHPPSLPDHDATVAGRDWVLLDARAYVSDRRNGTTATAFASNGLIVEVSFWFAAPPALSHFTVHCRGLDEKNGLAAEPYLVCSDEYVAVLSIDYTGDEGVRRNFFVYTAIPDRPSLVRLPSPGPFTFDPREMGLLRTADGEGFAVAVLSPQLLTQGWYNLHIFPSKHWRWITKSVQTEPTMSPRIMYSCDNLLEIDKVIALPEEGSLGWVNLRRGILLCTVLDENPVVRFMPLPRPMAGNNEDIENSPSWVHRDVAYVDGLIKFVEIKTRTSITRGSLTNDPYDINDVQFDSDLEYDNTRTGDTKDTISLHGWRVVAWVRKLSSDGWTKNCEVDVDDIKIDSPKHSGVPELRRGCSGKFTLTNMTAAPTLSMHGSDVVVYLLSKVNIHDENACIIAINMTRKTMEDVASFCARRTFGFSIACRPCSFSRHLDMTADHGEAVLQRKTSENPTAYTTVLVRGLDPCVTEGKLRQILARFGELHDMQMLEDEGSAVVKFIDRLCAESAICELSGTRLGCRYVGLKRDHVDSPNGPPKARRDAKRPRPYPEYYGADSCDAAVLTSHGYHPHKLRMSLPY
ncbi:hypothetical protein VPH35_093133 [Triticum aestivum]